MDIMTKDDLTRLRGKAGSPLVTIYLPLDMQSQDGQANAGAFRSAVEEAIAQLASHGDAHQELVNRLRHAAETPASDARWTEGYAGMVAFFSSESADYFALPVAVERRVVVGQEPCWLPAVAALQDDQSFYVLGITRGGVKLYRGTRTSIDALPRDQFPEPPDALHDYERQLFQTYQSDTTQQDTNDKFPRGEGHEPSPFEQQTLDYLAGVDRAIVKLLADKKTPLIIAGPPYLTALYEDINTYDNLLDPDIPADPESMATWDFHREAWKILEPNIEAERRVELRAFDNLLKNSNAVAGDDLSDLAAEGQVEVLFVDRGRVNCPTAGVISKVVDETFKHGGHVVFVPGFAEKYGLLGAITRRADGKPAMPAN